MSKERTLTTEEDFLSFIADHWTRHGGWAWRKICSKDPCVYCGKRIKPSKFTLEHILPISAGGSNKWDNKAACCCGCNVSRGSKPLLYHLISPSKATLNMWNQVDGPFARAKKCL